MQKKIKILFYVIKLMTFDRLLKWNNIFVYNCFIDNKNTEIQLFHKGEMVIASLNSP